MLVCVPVGVRACLRAYACVLICGRIGWTVIVVFFVRFVLIDNFDKMAWFVVRSNSVVLCALLFFFFASCSCVYVSAFFFRCLIVYFLNSISIEYL